MRNLIAAYCFTAIDFRDMLPASSLPASQIAHQHHSENKLIQCSLNRPANQSFERDFWPTLWKRSSERVVGSTKKPRKPLWIPHAKMLGVQDWLPRPLHGLQQRPGSQHQWERRAGPDPQSRASNQPRTEVVNNCQEDRKLRPHLSPPAFKFSGSF